LGKNEGASFYIFLSIFDGEDQNIEKQKSNKKKKKEKMKIKKLNKNIKEYLS